MSVKAPRPKVQKAAPRRRSSPGRPTKLTAEVQRLVMEALQAGNYMEASAAFAGVSKSVLYDWLKAGRAAKTHRKQTRAADFLDAVEKTMAIAEVRGVELVTRAGEGTPAVLNPQGQVVTPGIPPQWQAMAWRLERKYPDRWGRRQRLDIATPDEGSAGRPLRVVVDLGAGTPHAASRDEEE